MITAKTEIVIDTNVAIVANGHASQAGPNCRRECAANLKKSIDECRILLDTHSLILSEYQNYFSFSGQPGIGDAFFKWLHNNQANPEHCRKVKIAPHPDREFVEFPSDENLSSFDRSDRKFVAVALASGTEPEIMNASDTDWWHHRHELQQHGIEVVFLCPELMTKKQ